MVCKASEQLLREKIIKDTGVKWKWHKIQHGLNKSRLYQINLMHFFDKITYILGKGHVIDPICLNFSEVYDNTRGIISKTERDTD